MFRAMVVLFVALGSMLPGEVSAEQTVWVQCAVESYDSGMIMTANTTNSQQLVGQAAAACTDAIASGNWFGVDKYGSWKDQGYVPVCTVGLNAVEAVDVWAVYGDPSSAMAAVVMCGNADKDGTNRVTYHLN